MKCVKVYPGVVNTLGTPRSAERPGSITPDQQSIQEWTGRQRGPTVGKRVKYCMKYFYETRSHGQQDQNFDVIWRFNLRESNPGFHGPQVVELPLGHG